MKFTRTNIKNHSRFNLHDAGNKEERKNLIDEFKLEN